MKHNKVPNTAMSQNSCITSGRSVVQTVPGTLAILTDYCVVFLSSFRQ